MATRKSAAKAPQCPAGGKTLTLNGEVVQCSAAHVALYDAVGVAVGSIESAKAVLYKLVAATFGDTCPSYDVYTAAQRALRAQCEAAGKSVEHYRAQFAGAVMSLYKKLPESVTEDALKKRAYREAKKAKAKQALINAGLVKAPKNWATVEIDATPAKPATPGKVGAPAGQTQQHPVSESESLEQLVTRIGIVELMEAMTRILAADKATDTPARTLAAISAQLRRDQKTHEVAKAPQAPAKAPRTSKAKQSA